MLSTEVQLCYPGFHFNQPSLKYFKVSGCHREQTKNETLSFFACWRVTDPSDTRGQSQNRTDEKVRQVGVETVRLHTLYWGKKKKKKIITPEHRLLPFCLANPCPFLFFLSLLFPISVKVWGRAAVSVWVGGWFGCRVSACLCYIDTITSSKLPVIRA